MAAAAHLCSSPIILSHGGSGTPNTLPLAFGGRSASLKLPLGGRSTSVSPRWGSFTADSWNAPLGGWCVSRHCVTPRSGSFTAGRFCVRGAVGVGGCPLDGERVALDYEHRNAQFIEGMSRISDMFEDESNLLTSLKCIRQGGIADIELFESDEVLEALMLDEHNQFEETIISESSKDKFVPQDFQNNEDLLSLLDESST